MLVFDFNTHFHYPKIHKVSILVLVDVGLRQAETCCKSSRCKSFNPCFSGCWSSTLCDNPDPNPLDVSILVLVDVGLRLHMDSCHTVCQLSVSILVLVDVGLRHCICSWNR